MNKLWRWEENSYKQNQKRKILWTAAVICWLAALWVTWWVEHTLYGGIIDTGTFSYLGCSIGIAIGIWLRKTSGKEEKPMTKKKKWVTGILLMICLIVICWVVADRKLIVFAAQFICVFPIGCWLDYKRAKDKDADKISLSACAVLMIAVMLVVGTIAGPKIMGLTSTKQAEQTIAEQCFTDVEYLGRLQGRWAYESAEDKSFYTADMSEEWLYMVYGEKEDKPYRFLIDPKGGEILLAAAEKDEPELADWYRREKRMLK